MFFELKNLKQYNINHENLKEITVVSFQNSKSLKMKKALITSLVVLLVLVSCTADENSRIEQSLNLESVNYTLDGKILKVDFEVTEDDELIVLESENSILVEHFTSEHENYIEYHVDDSNVVLLRDDVELTTYLKGIGSPLKTNGELSSKSATDPYQRHHLELYYKCCYDTRGYFDWISVCDGYIGDSCADGQEVARLKNFQNATLWSSLLVSHSGCSISICHTQDRIYPFGDPDNQLESVIVKNVFARFYEHINYGGKSIVLDARGGQVKGHRKLRQVKNGGGWKDRISSVTLSF